jgi:hypothetical protein
MTLANKIMIFLLFLLMMTACNGKVVRTAEVTPVITQTVDDAPELQPGTATSKQIYPTPEETQLIIDMDDYSGIIVVTQYYTFLGHGLYEDAYQLLSSSAQQFRSLDEYVRMAKLSFKSVEIVSILPYMVAVKNQGGQIHPDPENKKRFAVQIKAWGEGNMSGSRENGELQDIFLELVNENGKWRIDSFATAPFP